MPTERTSSKYPVSVIALNYFPLVYFLALAGVLYWFGHSVVSVLVLVLIWIYAVPPLLCWIVIGGQSVLGPGSHVYPRESFPATRILGPFHTFSNGRRNSRSEPDNHSKKTEGEMTR